MRWEPILYSGVCGNECIRLMAQWERGMDELAVERLLQTVKDDGLRWHFYYRCWQCLPSGGKTRGVNRGRRRGKREEGGANAVTAGLYSMRRAAEKILFLCLWDVPGEDSRKIILYLFLGELQTQKTLQSWQSDETARQMWGMRYPDGSYRREMISASQRLTALFNTLFKMSVLLH